MIPFMHIRRQLLQASAKTAGLTGGEFTPERVREWRSDPLFAPLLEEYRTEAEHARSELIPPLSFSLFQLYATVGTRLEFELPYFERRRRLAALVLASLTEDEGENRYTAALEDLIWSICDEYSWALPAHIPSTMELVQASRVPPDQVVDLFASETGHALAETVYLLKDRLHPWVIHRVREEVEKRIFHPMFHTPVHFGWETSTNNWSAVCAGGVGMAALLLVEDRERLAGMVDRLIRALESFLAGYEADGCCQEGIGYWNYGFGYYVYFADMLYEYTDGGLNLFTPAKIQRIAEFPSRIGLEANTFINYSDSAEHQIVNTGLLCRLHSRLGQPMPEIAEVSPFHSDHCYRFPALIRNLLWTNSELLGRKPAGGPFFYPDAAWIVDRSFLNSKLIAFSAKGGHNDEPHNHNDLGHFILHTGGESLLSDLGAGIYTKDYFGPKRYTFLHNSSEGHSVPLVNGCPQQAGRHRNAILQSVYISEDGAMHSSQDEQASKQEAMLAVDGFQPPEDRSLQVSMELAGAYPEEAGLLSLRRTFDWTSAASERQGRQANLLLTDEYILNKETNHLEERFISFFRPVVEAEAHRVTWKGSAGKVTMDFDDDYSHVVLEEIFTHHHQGQPVTVYLVRLKKEITGRHATFRLRFACE